MVDVLYRYVAAVVDMFCCYVAFVVDGLVACSSYVVSLVDSFGLLKYFTPQVLCNTKPLLLYCY